MAPNSDKLLELLLEELRKNDDRISDRLESFNKSLDDKLDGMKDRMDEQFSNLKEDISSLKQQMAVVTTRFEQVDEHVKDVRNDVEHLEYTVKGNGTPGLKTKVELMEKDQSQLASDVEEVKNNMKQFNIEDKKGSTAVKVAIIGGAFSGFVALIKSFL